MALLRASAASGVAARPAAARPVFGLPVRRALVTPIPAQANTNDLETSTATFGKAAALSTAMAVLMNSGNALAASELAQVAAGDNRTGILLTLFVPALAWVAFNIGGPALSQLDVMGDKAKDTTPDKRSLRVKSIAGALGLGAAALLTSAPAEAATELSQIAAGDNRTGILLTLFVPALAWVAFNIGGPALSQLDVMGDKAKDTTPDKRSLRVKSIAGALGLGAAALLTSAPAEAATELSQIAAGDNRTGILLTLFVPALAWVAFNIGGPALSQLDVMGDKAKDTTPDKRSLRVKSIAGALGLGAAALLASAPAEAATELSQIAAGDNRTGILLTLFVPALAWVAFNIGGPALSQLDVMGDKAKDTTPDKRSLRVKSIAGALGLGAAALLASAPAEAATELSQIAAGDNRTGILLTLFVPALAWVAFNIGGPALSQLDVMGDKAKETTPDKRSIRK